MQPEDAARNNAVMYRHTEGTLLCMHLRAGKPQTTGHLQLHSQPDPGSNSLATWGRLAGVPSSGFCGRRSLLPRIQNVPVETRQVYPSTPENGSIVVAATSGASCSENVAVGCEISENG